MAELLQLKHTHIGYDQPEYTFYFYEGEVKVHYGVIDLPRDPAFEHWAMRAWLKGYRLDPETGVELTMQDLLDRLHGIERQAPAEPESAKSAGEDVEGTDTGRQPARSNRVRSRQPARRKGVSA